MTENMAVKYRNENQLFTHKDGATITLMPDIPNLVEYNIPLNSITLCGVQGASLQHLLCFLTCFNCTAKVDATNLKSDPLDAQNVKSYNPCRIARTIGHQALHPKQS